MQIGPRSAVHLRQVVRLHEGTGSEPRRFHRKGQFAHRAADQARLLVRPLSEALPVGLTRGILDGAVRSAGPCASGSAADGGVAHLTTVRSGFPFSTTYVASSAPLPLPTFLTQWIAPAGTKRTSPALYVSGGLLSI